MRTLLEAADFEVKEIELYDASHLRASADTVVRFSESSSFGNLLAHAHGIVAQPGSNRGADGLRTKDGG